MKTGYFVGDIVKVKVSFLGEPIGVLAYVYEEYGTPSTDFYGISLITENGCNLGGFSVEEQDKYLELVKKSNYEYHFMNVIQLDKDFEAQIKPLFQIKNSSNAQNEIMCESCYNFDINYKKCKSCKDSSNYEKRNNAKIFIITLISIFFSLIVLLYTLFK